MRQFYVKLGLLAGSGLSMLLVGLVCWHRNDAQASQQPTQQRFGLAAHTHHASGKLDPELKETGSQPIFVRMEDQLFKKGGDYEAFCEEHENERRSVVRAKVTKILHDKAESSWEKIKEKVASLEEDGQVNSVKRYWIINGFACQATGEACRTLAEDPNVSYVYLQPRGFRQHQFGDSKPIQQGWRLQAMEQLVNTASDDSDVPFVVKNDSDLPFAAVNLEIPWNLKHIQVDQVWEKEGITGKGVTIAVQDTGMFDIPAFRPALWRNPGEELNGKDDDGNGYIDDIFGYDFADLDGCIVDADGSMSHGTICAGIACGRAVTSDGVITGVAPRSRLMFLNGMLAWEAYEYALMEGADVISMSFWILGDHQSRAIYRTMSEHLSAAGVLPVGGAGNNGQNAPEGWQISHPKDVPCVLCVGGIMEDYSHPPASGKGPSYWAGVRFYDDDQPLLKPDLVAPFGGYPLWYKQTPRGRRMGNPTWVGQENDMLVVGPGGNSFSAPHGSGVAALIFSANPELNPWQVKRIMEETTKDLGDAGPDYVFGIGLVQTLDAVRAAKKIVKKE